MNNTKIIYIVDDSIVTRMFISSILQDLPNIEILQFANGEDVMIGINKMIPDLIILDSVMPVMDGMEVLEQLQEQEIDIPIIFCTADIQATTKKKATQYGIVAFMNKPIDKELLFETVKKTIHQ